LVIHILSNSTSVTYTGDNNVNQFAIPFNYISRDHVSVTVSGLGGTHVSWDWVNDNLIQITPTPADNAAIKITRNTPINQRMVDFVAGNTLSEADLDLDSEQSIYAIQEIHSKFDDMLSDELQPYIDEQGVVGVIDPKAMIDGLVQSILDSELLATLKARVDDIDANANSILQSIDTQLAANIAQGVLENRVTAHDTDIANESTARSIAEQLINDRINANDININNIKGDITTATAEINRVEIEAQNGRNSLATSIANLQASNGDLSAQLQTEITTRTDDISALSSVVNTLQAQTNRVFSQAEFPNATTDSLSVGDIFYDTDDGNHAWRWDGTQWIDIQDQNITSLQAQLQTEQTARIDGDSANASSITTLTSQVNTNKAAAESSIATLTTKDASLAQDITNLASVVDGNDAIIQSELSTLTTKDASLAQDIANLTANTNSQFAVTSSARATLTDTDAAQASDISVLYTKASDNAAGITQEQTARTNADNALSSSITNLASVVNDNDATIQTKLTALTTKDNALAQDITNLTSSTNNQFAVAASSRTTMSSDIATNASDISVLYTKTNNNEAAITSEASARSGAISAEANQRQLLQAEFDANKRLLQNPEFELEKKYWSSSSSGEFVSDSAIGSIVDQGRNGGKAWQIQGNNWAYASHPIAVDTSRTYKVRFRVKQIVDSSASYVYAGVATLDSNYIVQVGGAGTHRYCAVSGVKITVADGWQTFEGTIANEGDGRNNFRVGTTYVRPMFIVNYSGSTGTALVDSLEFFDVTEAEQNIALIQSESAVRVSAENALSSRIDSTVVAVNNNAAAIQSESTARASADSANASSITTLQTTVDSNTSSINQNLSSIDGLNAQWSIKTDVNGYVAGVGLNNSGASSEFIVLADKFAVVYAGKPKIVPFVVGDVNGVSTVGITGNLIVDGTIATNSIKANAITADKINVTNLQAISATMGTVTGGTFRTASSGYRCEISNSGAYPLWYGTGAKNSANAIFYVDTSGNAVFAGTLTAGSVDTLQLAENSITEANSATSTSTSTSVTLALNHNSVGKPCKIEIPISYHDDRHSLNGTFTQSAAARIAVTLKRGSTTLKTWVLNTSHKYTVSGGGGEPLEAHESNDTESSLVYVDTRTTQEARTYTVTITRTGGLAQSYADAQYIFMSTEFKR